MDITLIDLVICLC